jgi:hypothetical protein
VLILLFIRIKQTRSVVKEHIESRPIKDYGGPEGEYGDTLSLTSALDADG